MKTASKTYKCAEIHTRSISFRGSDAVDRGKPDRSSGYFENPAHVRAECGRSQSRSLPRAPSGW